MRKKIFINQLMGHLGETIEELFYLKKLVKKVNGKTYYNVYLSDATGEIEGKIWEEYIDPLYDKLYDLIVLVEAKVELYDGKVSLNIIKMTQVLFNYVCEDDFAPTVENIEGLKEELFELIEQVEDTHLQTLLRLFFNNDKILNSFMKRPASTELHHVYIGGLLEQTVNVAKMCLLAAETYKFHENFNKDLLLTAALLRDIGKIKEYSPFPSNKRTMQGRLLGHIVLSINMIYSAIKEIEDFPDDLACKLQHIILTHHGNFDSITPPMIIEAAILASLDNMDKTAKAMLKVIEEDTSPEDFSLYSVKLGKMVYKK